MKMLCCVSLTVLAVAGAGSTVFAAATNAPAVAAGPFVVPPVFVAPALPESVFVSPTKPAEGRDPFFPRSERPYLQFNPPKTTPLPTPAADLTLKGISGSKDQPLAIINTTTFTSGEENDVVTKAGKMRIRCVEIRMDDGVVVIQVGGESRVLSLARTK